MTIDIDDDGKIKRRWLNKSINALKEGIDFSLSFEEFCILVKSAGLVSSELGFSGGKKFVLARYGDAGGYVYGNCRFITQSENALEKKKTEKMVESCRVNVKKATLAAQKVLNNNPKIRSSAGKRGAATRNRLVAEELKNNDKILLAVGLDKCHVKYPEFGWKKRLAEELGVTKRRLDRFLQRNPSIIDKL